MLQDIKKYKVVRRGPKWCVRVIGQINTDDSLHWCQDRNMSCLVKEHDTPFWFNERTWWNVQCSEWDYDFIFDKPTEATAFILGYL